jgi:hypothetical protein
MTFQVLVDLSALNWSAQGMVGRADIKSQVVTGKAGELNLPQ